MRPCGRFTFLARPVRLAMACLWLAISITQGYGQPAGDSKSTSKPAVDPLTPPFSVVEGLKRSRADLLGHGTERLKAGRLSEAVEDFREMVALDPRDPMARMYLGSALERSGDRKGAREQY